MTDILDPFPYFPEAGTGGYIYVGSAGLDARTNPITVYRDVAQTLPWAQPIRTVNGYPAYQGAKAGIYSAASTVSLTVLDDNSRVVTNGTSFASPFDADRIVYDQGGTGAVDQTVAAKLRHMVSPFDFGAVGDGVADDTLPVQRALNTTAKRVIIDGTFNISASVTSSVDDRTIEGPGYLTATSPVDIGLIVYGDRNCIKINIDGNDNIGVGIRVDGADMPIIDGGRIFDLYSTTANCAGIFLADTQGGALIKGVTIDTVNSVGNGSLGDSSGFSRGIAIGLSGDPTGDLLIDGCHISNIIGEEGDAIAAVSGGGGTYYRLDLTVQRCTIRQFTRRAVKTQGSHVRVIGNGISNDWTLSTQVPNAATVIDFVQGDNCIARDNDLFNCNFFNQVTVFSQDAEVWNNFLIDGNTFWGLTSSHTNTNISFTPSGPTSVTSAVGGVIRDNIQSGGVGRTISVGKSDGTVVVGNIARVDNEASTRTISGSSGATKPVILGNILTGGTRESFIALDGTNGVVMANHVKADTPVFSNAAGSGNHLAVNNTADGTASFTFNSSTLTGNRLGGNYSFGTQNNASPGTLTVTQAGGPATSLAGLQVVAGQIVFDVTPSAGGKIGWTAITSGEASAVTWKQFGPIDA